MKGVIEYKFIINCTCVKFVINIELFVLLIFGVIKLIIFLVDVILWIDVGMLMGCIEEVLNYYGSYWVSILI